MSKDYKFQSGLSNQIQAFINEKQSLGCKYEKETKTFQYLDRFLVKHNIQSSKFPQSIVEEWIEKQPNETRKNQRWRLNFTKRFILYLRKNGYEAYYPDILISSRDDSDFVPYIFSNEEISKLMKYFENMPQSNQYPNGHLVYPLLFKTLICCGLRVGEASKLRISDVDLVNGILTIKNAKHNKTRYVPVSESLLAEYVKYAQIIHAKTFDDGYFFPNARGNAHHTNVIYERFRDALFACGIHHKGRGYGPIVHDLRHTFAVRCMQKLEATKGDIVTGLPYISMYLGHCNITKTQIYLHLIAEHFPELIQKQCDYLGDTIPTWEVSK